MTNSIDEYLAALTAEKRSALEKLRKDITSAAPKAEECIAYGIPTFRLYGKMLVSFGAHAKHCSFYPGAQPIREHRDALKNYDTEKGTIRFDATKPLPTTLVRKLVKTRVAQITGDAKATTANTTSSSTKRRSRTPR